MINKLESNYDYWPINTIRFSNKQIKKIIKLKEENGKNWFYAILWTDETTGKYIINCFFIFKEKSHLDIYDIYNK